MKNEFNLDELLLIRDLVEEEIKTRKEQGKYDYLPAIRYYLESTLKKVNYKIKQILENK